MALDALAGYPMIRGLLFAVAGVGFWVAGLVGANWLWNRLRDDAPD